jgi:hypothetical protein
MSQTISIKQLFEQGIASLQAEHDAAEGGKVGTLRAGNTGILMGTGDIIGKCHRLTYLRMKGINVEDTPENREHMFAGGRGNEDIWVDVLKRSWPGPILRESEIPISWVTKNGVTVTGRPDIVLCENVPTHEVFQNGEKIGEAYTSKPVKGIELKLVSSIWTARDVGILLKPKTMHLMQAAHYAWQLGVPFELWYTSRADFAVGSGWEQKNFPRQGKPGSERLEYNDKGGIKKVLPFAQGFELDITDKGQLRYRPVPSSVNPDPRWEYSIITTDAIARYYEFVASMEANKDLGPRPKNLEADGQKGGYSPCDYCPLGAKNGNGLCDSKEGTGKGKDFDRWLTSVQQYSAKLSAKK